MITSYEDCPVSMVAVLAARSHIQFMLRFSLVSLRRKGLGIIGFRRGLFGVRLGLGYNVSAR